MRRFSVIRVSSEAGALPSPAKRPRRKDESEGRDRREGTPAFIGMHNDLAAPTLQVTIFTTEHAMTNWEHILYEEPAKAVARVVLGLGWHGLEPLSLQRLFRSRCCGDLNSTDTPRRRRRALLPRS